jgi:hypothetical protein
MKNPPPAMKTALLPQYRASEFVTERFLEAAHTDDDPIERAKRDVGIQTVDPTEAAADCLNFFASHPTMANEFRIELDQAIGPSNAMLFCDVVANDWYRLSRNQGRPLALKRSIYVYLQSIVAPLPAQESVAGPSKLVGIKELFNPHLIGHIVELNDVFLRRYVYDWLNQHPDSRFTSSDEIYIQRGLALLETIDVSQRYKEWDYLNSYSLAKSVPEKFSLPSKRTESQGTHRAMVSGDLHLFERRVLFFSPFIPSMPTQQLEFGVIPSPKPLKIADQGLHAGIHEYLLDPILDDDEEGEA